MLVFHDFSSHRSAAEETEARTAALEALTTQLHLVAEISTVLIPPSTPPPRSAVLLRLLVPSWASGRVDVYQGQSDVLGGSPSAQQHTRTGRDG